MLHPIRCACGVFRLASIRIGLCLALFAVISKVAVLLAAPNKVHIT